MKEKNLKVVERHVAPRGSPFDLGYKFGMSLKDVRGSMIFSTSDFRGAGILTALDERGFQPGEYDLICCNNWEAYGFKPFPHPRLTSIDFRREECLREVVELLCSSIVSPNKECIRISKFPAKLKIREPGLKKDNQEYLIMIPEFYKSQLKPCREFIKYITFK